MGLLELSCLSSLPSLSIFPGLPDLFHRAPRDSSASVASAFSPLFFSWTARANGEREKVAIQVPDPSCHLLPLHQVSAPPLHAIYRLPDPQLFLPGPPDLFHRGSRTSTASVALAF